MLSAVARPSGTVLPLFFLSWVRTVAFSCSFSTISSVMPVTSWLSPAPPCSMAAAWLAACICAPASMGEAWGLRVARASLAAVTSLLSLDTCHVTQCYT